MLGVLRDCLGGHSALVRNRDWDGQLGMLPTEMSPSLNVSGAVHQGVLLPKNAGAEQPAERLMDSRGISSCEVCSFPDTAGIFLLKMAFFFFWFEGGRGNG